MGLALVDVERSILLVVGVEMTSDIRADLRNRLAKETDFVQQLEALQKAELNAWLIYRLHRFILGGYGVAGGIVGSEALQRGGWESAMNTAESKYRDGQNALHAFIKSHRGNVFSDQIKRGLKIAWETMPRFYVHDEKGNGGKSSEPTFYKDIIGWDEYRKYAEGDGGKQKYFAFFGEQSGYDPLLAPEELASFQRQDAYRLAALTAAGQ